MDKLRYQDNEIDLYVPELAEIYEVSRKQVYMGLKELQERDVIREGTMNARYFVNPALMYRGDRRKGQFDARKQAARNIYEWKEETTNGDEWVVGEEDDLKESLTG